MMHDRGVFLVLTLTVRIGLAESKFPPRVRAKADMAVKQIDAMVRRPVALGVKIALGTDASVFPHGRNAVEFSLMAADGLSPAQALQVGTIAAAELLGLSNQIGAVKPGLLADIIAVRGNPLTNISATQQVVFVMKEGVVYRQQ
jgi:imidazolonepropionase-like amidohydrolase